MLERGISPPPRHDEADAELSRTPMANLRGLLVDLDRWCRRLQAALPKVETYSVSINAANVAANTTSEQTFTVPGLKVQDIVYVNKPSHSSGLGMVNCRVSALDTLAITYMNSTGAGIDPGAETYTLVAVRR